MYGETGKLHLDQVAHDGLSPHVRGNPSSIPGTSIALRSIPACTGKPLPCRWAGWLAGVYPRMYGETPQRPVAGCTG